MLHLYLKGICFTSHYNRSFMPSLSRLSRQLSFLSSPSPVLCIPIIVSQHFTERTVDMDWDHRKRWAAYASIPST